MSQLKLVTFHVGTPTENDADPTIKDDEGRTPLCSLAIKGNFGESPVLWSGAGADPSTPR
jgi:ankyrin repeat protein